jgi:hypothetical protein
MKLHEKTAFNLHISVIKADIGKSHPQPQGISLLGCESRAASNPHKTGLLAPILTDSLDTL